jgi:hypothetical protein
LLCKHVYMFAFAWHSFSTSFNYYYYYYYYYYYSKLDFATLYGWNTSINIPACLTITCEIQVIIVDYCTSEHNKSYTLIGQIWRSKLLYSPAGEYNNWNFQNGGYSRFVEVSDKEISEIKMNSDQKKTN